MLKVGKQVRVAWDVVDRVLVDEGNSRGRRQVVAAKKKHLCWVDGEHREEERSFRPRAKGFGVKGEDLERGGSTRGLNILLGIGTQAIILFYTMSMEMEVRLNLFLGKQYTTMMVLYTVS